jgi:hypothetical protein
MLTGRSILRFVQSALIAVLIVGSLPVLVTAQCPRRFDEQTTGLPSACMFVGRFAAGCGGDAVALFAGDGSAMVVSLSTPSAKGPLFLPAHVTSATEGKLVSWRGDLELATADAVGSVRLADDGQRLIVRIDGATVSADGCQMQEFVGHFAGMVQAGPEAGVQTIATR